VAECAGKEVRQLRRNGSASSYAITLVYCPALFLAPAGSPPRAYRSGFKWWGRHAARRNFLAGRENVLEDIFGRAAGPRRSTHGLPKLATK